ncbi:hypothetical protein ACFQVC_40890 [Streptomyces monticola]|uniref:Lipoprotein n=1 Tax=Streptomyces monticola TaxID=2666263 RepID=A0ABW2JX50_9ACTN
MHRTTATAALLAAVAVSTVTGCVSVERPPVPRPWSGTAPAAPDPGQAAAPIPRDKSRTEPRAVPAPAHEALRLMSPAKSGSPAASSAGAAITPAQSATTPAQPGATPAQRRTAPAAEAAPDRRPAGRAPRTPRATPAAPAARAPKAPPAKAPPGAGVCALGKQYGGWEPDSPQARICRENYGG